MCERIGFNQNGLISFRGIGIAADAKDEHTTKMNSIITTITTTMTTAAKDVAPAWGVTDLDGFLAALMERMQVEKKAPKRAGKKVEKVEEAPKAEEKAEEKEEKGSVKSGGERKRVVSKKMKEAFLALPGATEEKLGEVMKAYKSAAEVTSFEAFARSALGLDAPAAAPKKEKKPKKEKSGRLDKWTPTASKQFKTIVEENGGTLSDELKKEFVTWLDGLADAEYADGSIAGHMRAFVGTKVAAKPAAAPAPAPAADEEDEELEEFTFEGETLLKGVESGKIYRPTEEAGDVLIGYAGKGRFTEVAK